MANPEKPSIDALVRMRDTVFNYYRSKICDTWVLDSSITPAIDDALNRCNYKTEPICEYIDHYCRTHRISDEEHELSFVPQFFNGIVPLNQTVLDCGILLDFYNTNGKIPLKYEISHIDVTTGNRLYTVIEQCYKKFNNDKTVVMQLITEYLYEYSNDTDIYSCFTTYADEFLAKHSTSTSSATTTSDPIRNSFGILEQALMEVIKKQSIPVIEQDIKSECVKMLQEFIVKEYGTIERKIVTVVNGEEHTTTGVLHEQFDTVLKFVQNDEPVFLSGPAGSGKNFICQQIAEVLGLKFYFSNAVTQEYKLIGFTDANGNYQPTQFYKAFTEGGLFMLDEIDASIPEVLVILNAAIANRYFDFPAPIGYKKAHPDFRVVAAGNTTGNGADYTYVGRNQLDGASLDRFAIVPIQYSPTIENNMAGDIELADFCREFRKASEKTGVQIITSYRAINRLAKMSQIMELPEALSTCLIKGLSADDINIICKELSPSKYKTALQTLAVNSSS